MAPSTMKLKVVAPPERNIDAFFDVVGGEIKNGHFKSSSSRTWPRSRMRQLWPSFPKMLRKPHQSFCLIILWDFDGDEFERGDLEAHAMDANTADHFIDQLIALDEDLEELPPPT